MFKYQSLKVTPDLSVCLLRGPTLKNKMGLLVRDNGTTEKYVLGPRGDSGRIAKFIVKDNVCQHKLQLHLK